MTTRRVRCETVAIKPVPGPALRLSDRDLPLPDGMALTLPWTQISLSPVHDAILLMENWEVFQAIHRLTFDIPEHLQNAICVYRGDGPGFSIEAVHDWLTEQALPVYVFSDPDPAGLVIALTTPGFAGLMFPSPEQIREKFANGAGDRARYLAQVVKSGPYLDKCDDPEIIIYRDIINEAGRALPQEEFIRL